MLCWNLLQVAVPFPVSGPDPEYALKVGDIVKVYSSATSDGHRGYSGKAKLIEKLGDIPDFWMVRFDDGGAYFNTFVYLSEQGGS